MAGPSSRWIRSQIISTAALQNHPTHCKLPEICSTLEYIDKTAKTRTRGQEDRHMADGISRLTRRNYSF
jgi:hypothetical protein